MSSSFSSTSSSGSASPQAKNSMGQRRRSYADALEASQPRFQALHCVTSNLLGRVKKAVAARRPSLRGAKTDLASGSATVDGLNLDEGDTEQINEELMKMKVFDKAQSCAL
eukprot:CAMPEP_0173427926 /NCGR_PEP_ID=MMETSP1357-20121228/7000_1 /TAXON_ID=77926 /ORGANISM="Hemiselmis rufescens, Strain PCC563" /LENGTH=110 /DNA_ID=CAMNT_0014391853 /DNA_START=65 /DNA_END=397 /DNA_ORIENTATION=-